MLFARPRRTAAHALLSLWIGMAAPAQAAAVPPSSGIDLSAFDPTVRAQDDLYRHVNGGWLARAEFPADKAYIGVDEEIVDRTRAQLRALIEAIPVDTGDPEGAKIAALYAGFMDEAAVERQGLQPLAGELAAIDAVQNTGQLVALLARFDRLGVNVPFGISVGLDDRDATRYLPIVDQGGLGLPNRDYYLQQDDATFRGARAQYLAYLTRLLTLAGGRDAEADARAILALETALAKPQWSQVEMRDPIKAYNLLDRAGLAALAPALADARVQDAAGLAGRAQQFLVHQPGYLAGLNQLLATTPLAQWKVYARARLLDAFAPYLGHAFVEARFDFAGRVIKGTSRDTPRWQRGVALVDQSLGDALGRRYVAAHFPPAAKARMDALVANLLAAYRDSIATLDWMGEATRAAALAKLAKINTKIGYPKRWIAYGALEIRRDDLAGNVLRARRFESDRNLAKLGRPVDRDEWSMTAQTVNAYYDPSLNEIVFPAAILQAPYFDPDADDAVNYGATGATIGHEISHAFDDQGSQYDGDGNLHNWWTAQDKERFTAKTRALVAQYAAFEPVPGYHIDGEQTLGENIADNSGLAIAYKAYRRSLDGREAPLLDGLSGDARFYVGYAQSWRSKTRDAATIAQLKSDPHAPDEYRVTGPVRNQASFYACFGVRPGDKMYLAPEQRVSIW